MAAKKIPLRSEVNSGDKWDLAPLYENNSEWEKDFEKLKSSLNSYDRYMNRLAESPEIFLELFEFDLETGRLLEKLYTYSHLKNDEDKTDSEYVAMHQKISMLYTSISEKSSFITPEIQSLSGEIIENYLSHEKISKYRYAIEKIIKFKPHTLDGEKEKLLSATSDIAGSASAIFSQLNNSDLSFGEITGDDGITNELSHGNFITFLSSQNRELRKTAFFQFYDTFDRHKNTIATSLYYSNRADWIYSKLRNYSGCRKASLFKDNVDETVYDNLCETVKNNLKPLSAYLDYRKKSLNLDELHIYDIYVPLVKEIEFSMSYDEAVETCIEALRPLGNEYCSILSDGLKSGWVDRYENKGKRSGAYSSGCYDSNPYILMNYNEKNIDSVYTLIHEAGHSMHSYYSCKNQDYVYHNYTIFVAEVASTFNEFLLTRYLLKKFADNPQMKKYILNREIDNIRSTLIRQTMFAEFEKITHEYVENDRPLPLDAIRKEYRKLLEIYFNGSIVIDDILELEALRIPHFYSSFYVYKYATGISAAIALGKKAVENKNNEIKSYLDFLKLGGSMDPLDELKTAGVDMSTSIPVTAALEYFGELVDLLIKS
ncbi:MAG: oligoendopeptidase F [Spirochaetes bacterium]|nr:oligoendopeptidase F [Spirochaetota bacterium]